MVESLTTDILIVGAGLSGLMAAHVIGERGLRAMLLDKGRSAGGRMATRRIGPGVADYGAQFFTVRDAEFWSFVDQWMKEGLVFEWSRGWNDSSLSVVRDGHPRYAVRGGANELARHLAQGLDVHVETMITIVAREGDHWRVANGGGRLYTARAVLLTAPMPQSLALLDTGRVQLNPEVRAALEQVEYAPCLTGMFWVDEDTGLPFPGGVQRPEANITWVADNRRKGISPKALIMTAQASPTYSRQLWDLPDDRILSAFRIDLLPFLRDNAKIVEAHLKRWRYSQPVVVRPDRFLLTGQPPLAFAGDAFFEPSVEGAALSGLAAGRALADAVQGSG